MRIRVRALTLVMLFALVGLVVSGSPVAVADEGCPNEAMRQTETLAHPEGFASGLQDCRAYEQVTPVNKDGTSVTGGPTEVQASPAGGGIVFPVEGNMPGGSTGEDPTFFLASRGGGGWSAQGLQVLHSPRGYSHLKGWSEDLSVALNQVSESPPSSPVSVYLRDSADGSSQLASQSSLLSAEFFLAGFSADDSRMIFEMEAQLLPSAAAGVDNLYEFHAGTVSLVGVLPDGSTPTGGSFAGPYNWEQGITIEGGARREYYTEGTISKDGSRVFFTAGGTEQIYVREHGTSTVPVGAGAFMAATPDGSKVVYRAGGELFEFDVESEQTIDLTPAGGVQGVLGVSDDGSYVYFAANGSLYVAHDGNVSFIAEAGNPDNWLARYEHFTGRSKVSRVTPDGRVLLFAGSNGFYRYQAVNGRLACVTCDPSGAPPTGPVRLSSIEPTVGRVEPSILLRNLSVDGSRVFFETLDALVPQDTNGVQDVYEWEQQGVGGCQGSSATFSAASGGCLYLISPGRSPNKSYLADASASGDDVFFYTDQPLVGQDQDGLVDIYDARVGGGFAAQNPPPPLAACEGEGCRPVAGDAPVFGAPVSATFSGAGNLALPAIVAAPPRPKAKHKAAKPKRKHKKKQRQRGRGRKAARGGRGAVVRGAMRGGK